MKKVYFFVLFLNLVMVAQSRSTLKGNFPQAANKEILLKKFVVFGDSLLAKTTADSNGKFSIDFSSEYVGAAILEIKDDKKVIVILNHENFEMYWDDLTNTKSLSFVDSPENSTLSRGLDLYYETESKRAGLSFLVPLYDEKSKTGILLKEELNKQDVGMSQFLSSLPSDMYARFYIKLRKLLDDMPQTASRYISRISVHEKDFNSIDFSNPWLLNSGLIQPLFERYFTLMESYSNDIFIHTNQSIDSIIRSLKSNPYLLQEVTQNLFTLLEKRSQFPAAEHLALAMLDDTSCLLDDKHKSLFEQYRKMAKGQTATEIVFPEIVKGYSKLSDIKSKYRLIVFGSSFCTKCIEDLPKFKPYYENWKNKDGLEIVFVSLDQDKTQFVDFSKDFPWISICDYQSWEGQIVKDYCVFATPTMYLLDRDNTIAAKVLSAEHLESWLDLFRNKKS